MSGTSAQRAAHHPVLGKHELALAQQHRSAGVPVLIADPSIGSTESGSPDRCSEAR